MPLEGDVAWTRLVALGAYLNVNGRVSLPLERACGDGKLAS